MSAYCESCGGECQPVAQRGHECSEFWGAVETTHHVSIESDCCGCLVVDSHGREYHPSFHEIFDPEEPLEDRLEDLHDRL